MQTDSQQPATVAKPEAQGTLAATHGSVTVAYSIINDDEWRNGGNPLKWQHHGLKAHTVAVYDAFERLEIYRLALEEIADLNTGFSDADKMNSIAKRALEDAYKSLNKKLTE